MTGSGWCSIHNQSVRDFTDRRRGNISVRNTLGGFRFDAAANGAGRASVCIVNGKDLPSIVSAGGELFPLCGDINGEPGKRPAAAGSLTSGPIVVDACRFAPRSAPVPGVVDAGATANSAANSPENIEFSLPAENSCSALETGFSCKRGIPARSWLSAFMLKSELFDRKS